MANGSSNDLDLALRIQADLDDAHRKVAQLAEELKKIEVSGKKAGKGIDETAEAAARQAKAIADAERAARRKERANRQLEDSERRAGKAADRASQALRDQQRAAQQLASGNVRGAAETSALGLVRALPIGATVGVAAIAAITAAAVQGYREIREFERSIIASGNAAGVTAGQLADMASNVGWVSGQFGDARVAAGQLAASGVIAADQLSTAIQLAADLAELTGGSIETTTAKVIKLGKAPSATLRELNDQYHFLTAEVYEHVVALEEQEQTQAAVRQAIELTASVHRQRAEEMREQAGWIESAWVAAGTTIRGIWDGLKDIGRDTDQQRLRAEQRQLQTMQESGMFLEASLADQEAKVKALQQEIALKQLDVDMEAYLARREAAKIKGIDDRRAAEKKWREEESRYLSNAEKLEAEIAAAKELGAKAGQDQAQIEERIAKIRARHAERQPKGPKPPKGTDPDAAAERELANLRRQRFLLDEIEDGETRAAEAARIRYEIANGAYRTANPALQQQLQDEARLLDIDRQRIEAAKQLVAAQLEIARIQGRPVPPELDHETQQLQRTAQFYEEAGQAAEAATVRQVLAMREAQQELELLHTEYQSIMGAIDIAQQRIQLGVQAGLITEAEARRQIVQLYQEQGAQLDLLLPRMAALAEQTGNPQALANVQRMSIELERMRATTNELVQSIGTTFEQSFSSALESLASGTVSLAEAGRQFFVNMAQGMARFAAEQLAAIARTRVLQALAKRSGGDNVGQGAAELTTAAGATAVAGGVVSAGATALQTAATTLQSAATTLLIANSMSSAVGFSGGGYTGPGGKYQVAGVVHRGEGVLNQREIRALGGPAGFYALRAAIANGYAGGGLVTMPREPQYSFADGGMATQAVPSGSGITLINAWDLESALREVFNGPVGDDLFVNSMGRNRSAVKSTVRS